MANNDGFRILEANIVKSPMDPKKYEIIELSNGIKCTLISSLKSVENHRKSLTLDGETGWFKEVKNFNKKIVETSAVEDVEKICEVRGACANQDEKCAVEEQADRDSFLLIKVNGGTFHDCQAGVAHLTEHAVLLGSRKFPLPNEWLSRSLLTAGEVDASTGWEDTQYSYQGNRHDFVEFVDRLSDLVAYPTLDKDMILREMHSVDAEHASRVTEEELRILQLVKSISKNHPVRNFSCGNLTTLNETSPQNVVKNHEELYKAQNMYVLMAAPFPMHELEEIAVKYFSEIPIGEVSAYKKLEKHYEIGRNPFANSMKEFNMVYRVVPLRDKNCLNLTWSLSPSVWKNYLSKPLDLIHTMLSYRGHGGFIYCLTKLGWLIRLSTGFSEIYNNEFNSFFNLLIELTPEGINHFSSVLAILFSYLNWLKCSTKCQLTIFFEEMRLIKLNEFHYEASTNTLNTAALTKINLNYMKDNEILLSEVGRILDFKAFQYCLGQMKPSTANYIIYSKNYASLANLEEPNYHAKYSRVPIPKGVLKSWETSDVLKDKFHFPQLNPFIPKGNIILPGKKLTRPRKFEETNKMMVVYLHNNRARKGDLPTSTYTFSFKSSNLNQENPTSIFHTHLWVEIMNFELLTRLAQASLASVVARWSRGFSCLILKITGASFKLHEVLDTCLSVFKDFQNCENFHTLFEVFRERSMRENKNEQADQLTFAIDILSSLMFKSYVSLEQLHNCGKNCKLEKFVSFITEFKKEMFVNATLDGDVIEWQFNMIVNLIKSICFEPLKPTPTPVFHVMALPIGQKILRVVSRTPESHVSLILQIYCCGINTGYHEQLANNISTKLYIKMFTALRTKEQMSFKLGSLYKTFYGIGFLYVYAYVQSDKFTSGYVEERLCKFNTTFYEETYKEQEDLNEDAKEEKKFMEKFMLKNKDTFRHITMEIIAPKQNSQSQPLESKKEMERKEKEKGRKCNGNRPNLFDRPYRNVLQQKMIENDLEQFGIEHVDVEGALESLDSRIIGIDTFKQSLFTYPSLIDKDQNNNII